MHCPYCFSPIDTPVTVCRNPQCAMHDQPMPLRSPKLLSRLPDRIRVRGGQLFSDRDVLCDACGLPCDAVCPSCDRRIPNVYRNFPAKTVLFLGVNGVGKSTLLTTSKSALCMRESVLMTALDAEETGERFFDRYSAPLLYEGQNVPHTPAEKPMPFLWGVTSRPGKGPANTMALSLYDVPGELLTNHAAAAPIETLLSLSDALVLVIDPSVMPGLREDGGEAVTDLWEKNERILDEFLRRRRIGVKCEVPAAVVFTHMDKWLLHTEYLSQDAMNASALAEFARRHGGSGFLNRLREFEHFRLFATGLCFGDKWVRPLDGADEPLIYLFREMGMLISDKGN